MVYRHGIYISELATSITPPVQVSAGLIVAFGTAPVNQLEDPASAVNKPIIAYTYAEAVSKIGYSTNFEKYTLSEVIKVAFGIYGVAPVVFINVLDPAKHKKDVTDELVKLSGGKGTLSNDGVLYKSVVVKKADGDSPGLTVDTDYVLALDDNGYTVITAISGGKITEKDATLKVSYTHLDPGAVTKNDIIGGVDSNTKANTGLELLSDVYPRFKLVPGQVIAPGFSSDSEVGQLMAAKAALISELFKAEAITDAPTDKSTISDYSAVPEWKQNNNHMAANQTVCWPMVKLGDNIYHHSTHLAAATCLLDSQYGDIPSRSPSNIKLQMDGAVRKNGSEVWLNISQANYLNGQGIVTSLNFDGWKSWGNRNAIYPTSTDPKDAFRVCRRMFNWVGNTLILSHWSKIDNPANRRLIESIVTSANIWLNGLTGNQDIAGGVVTFDQSENTITSLMDGIVKFHVKMTPFSPARDIEFVMEYNPDYLLNLFSE
ncbi:TPA: phage tail sheath family protein [Escherichia coli]|nr:phage tail sheath family protein [Escherichia coli]